MYICERCGKESTIKFGSGRFCSRACANKREHSEETKKKISESVKANPSGAILLQMNGTLTENMTYNKSTLENGKLIEAVCPVCGNAFTYGRCKPKTYCSNECWRKVSGGFREGSVKNHKHGWFSGYHYDSSWELIWIKWALNKNIRFERNTKGFPYIFKGEQHLYYPDFYLPDTDEYVEVKGITDELWEAKRAAFPHKLSVVTKVDIKLLEKEFGPM